MLGKRHGKFWLTIVGEMPMASIRQVADAVELAETLPK
jgi:sigma-E factor negative regulatory protein RseB